MSVFAKAPLEGSRTPRITLEADREVNFCAAERPRPVLEPVIRIVFPVKRVVGLCRGFWRVRNDIFLVVGKGRCSRGW